MAESISVKQEENATSMGVLRQVIGPVCDIAFEGSVPPVLNALKITNPSISDKEWNLVLEVATHLSDGVVRAIAMDSTDGLVRGAKVLNTGAPIQVPVGKQVLSRILNVIGEPVDDITVFELENGEIKRGILESESDTA